MARTSGSVGIVRREFETEFYESCHKNGYNPGAELARLMAIASRSNNIRDFVACCAILMKATGVGDADPAQSTLLVVDRRSSLNPEKRIASAVAHQSH